MTSDDPVVIVGMAIEAPGGVTDADSYWSLLSEQREALGRFPTDRGWAIRDLLDGSRRDGFKPIHDLGGFLDDAAAFDPAFFGISPREAVAMDPQQRVALRLAWRALENSGINPDDVAGHDVGCYVGASYLEYGPELTEYSNHSGHLITGTSLGVISGRIAYTLDLAGPAMTIDTSCSSALTAFHMAAQAIRSGDCDLALTGGVCVMGTPGYFVEFSKQHALSDDGRCRPYSALASGTVWAEGAAMFLLQKRSRALADGRHVLAEVLASTVNQDGRTVGLTAPSGTAQARLFGKAIDAAGVRPQDVGMIEGHGTGTRLGDRTELVVAGPDLRRHRTGCGRTARVGQVERRSRAGGGRRARPGQGARRSTPWSRSGDPARRRGQPRDRLGSTRSAPGRQADAVARNRRQPDRGGVGVRHEWNQRPRRGVDARAPEPRRGGRLMVGTPLPDGRTPVLLSAHAEDLVAADAAAILAFVDRRPATEVADVASTLLRTRRLRRYRAVVRAADADELRAGLAALAAGDDHPLVTRATAPGAQAGNPRVAFVFPGQGSQWPSMGAAAYDRLPEYRAEVDACAAVFSAVGAASPLDYLLAKPGARTNDFSQVRIQGAQFVHGVALARVWRSAGVLPDITVGHSLGEIGAAYVAGAITLPVAVGVVIARATLLDRLTGPYRVAVLGITEDEARDVIAHTPGWLELSVVNSKSSVAVSGDGDAVAAAVRAVSEGGSFAKPIEMWFPAHTTALDPMRSELDALLPGGEFLDTPVEFIGSATADIVPAGTSFADYWYGNLRSTVRFDRAVATAVDRGARTFVEMSAHPALLFAMGDVLDDLPDVAEGTVTMVGSGRRDEDVTDRLSANIAAVVAADTDHGWTDPLDRSRKPLRDFPFAPMRTGRHWAAPEPLPPIAGITVAVEQWQPVPATTAGEVRRVAVLDAGEPNPSPTRCARPSTAPTDCGRPTSSTRTSSSSSPTTSRSTTPSRRQPISPTAGSAAC